MNVFDIDHDSFLMSVMSDLPEIMTHSSLGAITLKLLLPGFTVRAVREC